jgi:hypothetical protein
MQFGRLLKALETLKIARMSRSTENVNWLVSTFLRDIDATKNP